MKNEPPLLNKGQVEIYMTIAIIALYIENFITRKPGHLAALLKIKAAPWMRSRFYLILYGT